MEATDSSQKQEQETLSVKSKVRSKFPDAGTRARSREASPPDQSVLLVALAMC